MSESLLRHRYLIEDRYLIENPSKDRIGAGSMGEVFLGQDIQTGQDVAIKVLKPDPHDSPDEMIVRFIREGKALRKLDHPNIVDVIDTVKTPSSTDSSSDEYYIVMEYVNGGTLRDRLNGIELMPMERSLEVGLDLSDALTRAHRLGIIHRDIKASNILLTAEGTPRLTDFGLALLRDSTSLTESGTLMGTINYLSPEACNGEVLDEKSDIWSFGILLWEMLAGTQPFRRENIGATLTAILSGPLPDFREQCPESSERLSILLNSMLKKDRRYRIPSMRMVGVELDTMLQQYKHIQDGTEDSDSWQAISERDESSRHQETGLSTQTMVDGIISQSIENGDQVLDKTSFIFIQDNRTDLQIGEPGNNILLRSALYHGEASEPWLDAARTFDTVNSTLLSYYDTYPRPEVRYRIVDAMGQIPGESTDHALINIALTDDSPEVRAKAALSSAERGYQEQVTVESLTQAEQGQDAAIATLVALSDEFGLPSGGSNNLRLQVMLSLARKRWKRYRRSVWNRTRKVAFSGGLLLFYGAAVPILMRELAPGTYETTLTYMTLPAYFAISIILFGLYGFLQGLILGFAVSVVDALQHVASRPYLRLAVGAVAGLFTALCFIVLQLTDDEPPPAPTSTIIVANIFYGLILAMALSRVIPPLKTLRTRKDQVIRMAVTALITMLFVIPISMIIYRDQASSVYVSRMLLALTMTLIFGLPFVFPSAQDRPLNQ